MSLASADREATSLFLKVSKGGLNPGGRLLSPREEQILDHAALGLTDMAIAHELGISEGTVGSYWARIRSKFGPHSRTRLVAIACRLEYEQELAKLREEHLAALRAFGVPLSGLMVIEHRDDSPCLV